jgi:hypothetical protein
MSKKIRPRQIWVDKDSAKHFRIIRVRKMMDVPSLKPTEQISMVEVGRDRRHLELDISTNFTDYYWLLDEGY